MDIATLQDYFSNFNAIQTKSHFKQQATAFFADFRNCYDRQPEKRFALCGKRGRGLNVLFFRLHQAFEAA